MKASNSVTFFCQRRATSFLRWRIGGGGLGSEQRHRVVLEVDRLDLEIAPLPGDLSDPVRCVIGKAIGPDACDDDGERRPVLRRCELDVQGL
jgi:hypothetical protein